MRKLDRTDILKLDRGNDRGFVDIRGPQSNKLLGRYNPATHELEVKHGPKIEIVKLPRKP